MTIPAEALARSNRYAAEDKIVDVAVALERMYEPENSELNFKLKIRAACFLEADTERRKQVFQEIDQFYKARSAIVHWRKRKRKRSVEKQDKAFEMGFELARRTLIKLLRDGRPEDWNDVVLKQGET